MKVQFWNNVGNIYWRRIWLLFIASSLGWGALAAILPAKVFVFVSCILGAGGLSIGAMIRGIKFVQNRDIELPPPGDTL